MKKFEMGVYVEDLVTGFEGYVIGRVDYLTGCNQYLVQPKCNDKHDKKPDGEWFDEQRLRVDVSMEPLALEEGEKPGACDPAPIK